MNIILNNEDVKDIIKKEIELKYNVQIKNIAFIIIQAFCPEEINAKCKIME